MKIILKFKDQHISSVDEILVGEDFFPTWQLKSPKRSTVPLLAFWKTPTGNEIFLRLLKLQPPSLITMTFEYEVGVQEGRGYSSCTDLMIEGEGLVVAVEAKYTEPLDKSVKIWLKNPPSKNRKDVLNGWLSLINTATHRNIKSDDVLGLPYQMIHRLASTCFPLKDKQGVNRVMVYQWFIDSEESIQKYTIPLSTLKNLIGNDSLQIALMTCKMCLNKSPSYKPLVEQWNNSKNQKELNLSKEVIEGLRKDGFICFNEPKVLMI